MGRFLQSRENEKKSTKLSSNNTDPIISTPNFGVILLNSPFKAFICSPKFPKLFKKCHEISNLALGPSKK